MNLRSIERIKNKLMLEAHQRMGEEEGPDFHANFQQTKAGKSERLTAGQ
jgi:hypothetical protein